MRVLVTGATGYVGGRLVPELRGAGHQVQVFARDRARLPPWPGVVPFEGDLLDGTGLDAALEGVDAAYYLVHSMGDKGDFEAMEQEAARRFAEAAERAGVAHIVYLGGLQPDDGARPHLRSRAAVGRILAAVPTTELRAGPIVGSGSASFEMVRYLTERLPVMVTPRWVDNRIEPIAIRDVLAYLVAALEAGPSGVVDIGSGAMRFRDMMLGYARVRGLRRRIVKVPVLAPTLAARWVQFITPITNRVAIPILDGMRENLVADTTRARALFPNIRPMPYEEAVRLALARIDADDVTTRWSDAGATGYRLDDQAGMKQETRAVEVAASPEAVFDVVQSLGGDRGWLAWDWAWRLRGAMDRAIGGPGLRRGRRSQSRLEPGDAVDFWRVEAYDPPRLLRLRAEMKVPGKAWLEFEVEPHGDGSRLVQTALFEPRGAPGWAYWNGLYPIHRLIFRDLCRAVARTAEEHD